MNWHDPADVARLEAMRDDAMTQWKITGYPNRQWQDYISGLIDTDPLARIRELEAENARLLKTVDEVRTENVEMREYLVAKLVKAESDLAALREQLETEQIRLAACSVAALSNTRESFAAQGLPPNSPYFSASYSDVRAAVTREMELRERHQRARAVLRETWAWLPCELEAEVRAILDAEPGA